MASAPYSQLQRRLWRMCMLRPCVTMAAVQVTVQRPSSVTAQLGLMEVTIHRPCEPPTATHVCRLHLII